MRTHSFRLGVVVLVGALVGVCAARADGPPSPPAKERLGFDPETGRNLLNYPPHVLADVRHMRLHLRIPDMNDRTILATETLIVAPIAGEVRSVTLNAALLQISGVTCGDRTCTYTKNDDDQTLSVHLDPPISKGQTAEITLSYRVSDPPEGLIWTTESPAFPGRAAQIHSQGESESNRYWFACHDFPNARATSELIVTVPRGFQVISNGRLVSQTQESMEPYDTFHWLQDKPHATYLVSMVVGKFDVVDVGSASLPMPVYVPPGQGPRVRETFVRTPRMVDLIARLTGEPYPWAKYGQVSVYNFWWGGMENTSATTLFESITLDKTAMLDGDEDDLIVHELTHQWFGDLLTCKSWEHIWLNEGFATYVEALWPQYRDSSIPSGKKGADGLRGNTDAYQAMIWGWYNDVIKSDVGAAPYQPAMVSKEYDAPDAVFDRAANPYPKGASILHMLRQRLGDEAFFAGLADYVAKNRFTAVETFQFREAMEKAGGVSLQRFFDQWAYRPGVPRIWVTPSWDGAAGMLSVKFEQQQTIDGYNPAFDVSVPVWVRCKGERGWRKLEARFDEKTYTLSAPLPGAPDIVVIDPELATLADYQVQDSSKDWIEQLRAGPTLAAKLRAVKTLGDSGDESAVEPLAALVRDGEAPRDVRIEAAKSLKSLVSPSSLSFQAAGEAGRALVSARIADARVRAAVLEGAAEGTKQMDAKFRLPLASQLAGIASSDPSYGVRAAAVRGLGILKATEQMAAIQLALATDSQHDQIRKAALEALADLDTPEAAGIVLGRTAPGNSSAVRAAAAEALGKLAHHEPQRVFDALAVLVNDREPRTAGAAGKALSHIGGPKVKALFEQRLAVLTSRFWKGQTREWMREMAKESGTASATTP